MPDIWEKEIKTVQIFFEQRFITKNRMSYCENRTLIRYCVDFLINMNELLVLFELFCVVLLRKLRLFDVYYDPNRLRYDYLLNIYESLKPDLSYGFF